jgi:hypothetical protein
MKADAIPLKVGRIFLSSSIISLKNSLSFAKVKIVLDAAVRNLFLKPEEWPPVAYSAIAFPGPVAFQKDKEWL